MRFALLILYAAGTLSAPVLDKSLPKAKLNEECSGSRFRAGTTFEYEYEGTTVHKVEGTTEQNTGLQLNAKVLITQLQGCAFHMKLANVGLLTKSMDDEKFTEGGESAAYSQALTQHDLLFNMKGNAVTSVRPHSEESIEIVNVKRGILSTLNLDESATTESDVHGTCNTNIIKQGSVVVKTKELSECSDRVQEEIGIQSSTIKTSSNMKPLDSKSTCTYALNENDITKVICEETHVFRPFSGSYEEKTSGAITSVTQTLKFITSRAEDNTKVDIKQYTSSLGLTYDHAKTMSAATSLPPAIEVVMKRLVEGDALSAKDTSANEFTSMVRMIRKLDKKEMKGLWDKYFDCVASKVCTTDNMKDLYRQYMLDAIAYCGSPTCVSVVKDVTMSGEIEGERANMFLQSIALVAKTDNSMIRDILDIAEKKPTRQVYLTLGTLISRHCAKAPQDCDAKTASAVQAAEDFLTQKLGDCSGQEDHERVEEILLALKAIGNAARPVSAQAAIVNCGVKSLHSNVTMSAFEALRDMPCAAFGDLLKVISNEHMDADKRIFAFRAAMKCSSADNLLKLVQQYNTETNKQLASYMWTYFTNLLESTNPDDKEAKSVLAGVVAESPLKATDLSMLQYSKHFEKSLYIDRTGATAKADVIFHPDGFLPRTASVDVSAKVMGVPMDIVQTAVGIDGVETVLENMFGPDGAIPRDFALKMFDWEATAEKLRELAGKEDEKSRQRRAASSKRDDMPLVNNIDEEVNMKPVQPSGFMSLRIMGQEVRMMSYDDIYAMIDQIDDMNVIQLMSAVAKGGKKTFSKSVMFLEMIHTVPTGLGLPLKLALSGSTVGTVDLEGKFDIRNMFWGKGAMNINGHVKTSAVVEILGAMSTESNYVSTGLRVMSNMMVSNLVKGGLQYKSGQLLKINIDTPEKPVQLFKMSSTPFMFLNENYKMIEGTPRMINKDACLKSQLIGYGLCTSVRVPLAFRDYAAPYFPLTGPAHFGVTLVRGDEKLSTFQFLTTMTKEATGTGGVIEFSTPGATYERRVSGKMFFSDVNNEKKLTLSTEKLGKTGSVQLSYNSVTRRTSFETTNDFFTPKPVTTRATFFNQTAESGKQMGVKLSAEYDWYKFEHVTKVVAKGSTYTVSAHTEYWPKKSITTAFELDLKTKQVKALIDINQVRQAVEMIARLESVKDENGVMFTFIHIPTSKTAILYTGINNEENKKELKTSLTVMGKQVTNVLGWYNTKGVQSIADEFTFEEKSGKVVASYEERKDGAKVHFRADVLGKNALSTIVYTNRGIEKTIDVTAKVLNKKFSTAMIITNSVAERSLLVRMTSMSEPTTIKFGYYNNGKVTSLVTDAQGFNSKVQMLATLDNDYNTSFGFKVNEYTGGVRVTRGEGKQGCATVYYKATAEEQTALKACGNIIYNGLADTSVSMTVETGLGNAGMKMFTKRGENSVINMGVEVNANDNTVLLLNKYQTGKIATSLVVNDKPLPVSTEVVYNLLTSSQCVTSIAIKMGDYSIKNGFTLYHGGKYGLQFTSGFFKEGEQGALFGIIVKQFVDMTTSKMSLVQKAGVTIEGKDYIYGWTLGYENSSTEMKRVHAVSAQIHYSNTKSSTVTFTMADSVNKASLNIDVEYVPTKHMSHHITLNKNKKSLDASIEFMPNMFAKFTSALEQGEGYMLQSRASLEWEGFSKSITIINSYINDETTFMISANFAKDLSMGVRVNKVGAKSVTLFGDIFGNQVKLELAYEQMNLSMKLKVNDKVIFQVKGGYDQWQKAVRIFAAQHEKIIVELKSSYNKAMKSFNLALAGVTKWAGIYVTQRGKNLEKTVLNVDVLGKGLVRAIINKKINSFAIHTLRGPRFSISWKWASKSKTLVTIAKTHKSKMMLSVRVDPAAKIFAMNGFINKKQVGMKLFFVKKSMIFKVTLTPKNIMKAVFTNAGNQLRVNLHRIVDGKSLNQMTFAYAYDTKLTEVMFKYNKELIKKITEFLQPIIANTIADAKELLDKVKNSDEKFMEISKEVEAQVKALLQKVDKSIQEFDIEPIRAALSTYAKNIFSQLSAATTQFLNTLAEGLDTIKTNTPQTVEKLREVIKNCKTMVAKCNGDLKTTVKVIVEMIEKLVKQGEELIGSVSVEGKVLVQKAMARGKELIKKGEAVLKELSADVEARFAPMKKAVEDIVNASKPVVEKFVQLAKDFKLRGMRVEDIINKATSEARALIKEYVDKIVKIVAKLEDDTVATYKKCRDTCITLWAKYKTDVMKMLADVEEYAMKVKVPLINQNLKQVVERVRAELLRLIKWARTVDMKQLIKDTKTTVTAIVEAKTEEFAKKMDEVSAKYKDLKAKVPKIVKKVMAVVQKYLTQANLLVNQVAEFAKPMQEYLKIVEASVSKHFGPLVDQITVPEFLKFLSTIEIADLNEFFEKEIKPMFVKLLPAYKNAVKQVRSIKVGGFRLGPLFDMQTRAIRDQISEALTQMKKELISLRKEAFKLTSKSPKWYIRTSIDASVKVINQIVSYMKYVYKNKEAVLENAMEKVEMMQKKLNAQYALISSKSFEQVTEETLKITEDSIVVTSGHLADLIRQLVAMDISAPTWKAITDINVKEKMERLAVSWKIQHALRYAKQANVTELVMNAIKSIQEFINLGIKETSVKAIAMYENVNTAYKYLKSIPKKDYEAWLQEAAKFTQTTRDVVEQKITKIFEMTKVQAAKAQEFLAKIKKEQLPVAVKTCKDTYTKVCSVYNVIVEKSELVYEDLKAPTKHVLNHYKNVIVPLVQKYSAIIMKTLTTEAQRLYTHAKLTLQLVQKRIEMTWELFTHRLTSQMKLMRSTLESAYNTVVTEYNKLMLKYGDLTWEQIVEKVKTGGMIEIQLLKERLTAYYELIVLQVNEMKKSVIGKATDVYEIVMSEVKALISKYETELTELKSEVMATIGKVQNEAIALYAKYEKKFNEFKESAKVEIKNLKAQLEVAMAVVNAKVTEVYNANKDKTLKQIVDEVKAILESAYLKHEKIVKAVAAQNFEEARKQIAEVQTKVMEQYQAVETLVKDVVLPELKAVYKKLLNVIPELEGIIEEIKKEAESISIQLIKNSAVMSEVMAKAYAPQISMVKDLVKKYSTMIRSGLPEMLKKWEAELKKKIEEVSTAVQNCLNNCEKSAMEIVAKIQKIASQVMNISKEDVEKKLREVIAQLLDEPKLKKAIVVVEAKFNQLKKIISELVEKVKTNPELIKLRTKIVEKVTELKGIFKEEFDRIISDPKMVELRSKVEAKFNELKAFVEEAVKNGKAFVEVNLNEVKAVAEQKINELKFIIMVRTEQAKVIVADLEKELKPIVEEVFATLRQIVKSGKFTSAEMQKIAGPYVKNLVNKANSIMSLLPELTKQAIKYLKTNPKQALETGLRFAKTFAEGLIARSEKVTAEDVKAFVLDFYTKVVVRSEEIYNKVTDQWTKEAITKAVDMIKKAIAVIEREALKLKSTVEDLPEMVNAYIEKNLPILKEMFNQRYSQIKDLITEYINTVKVEYIKLESLLKTKLVIVNGLIKDTTALVEEFVKKTWETVEKYVNSTPFFNNKIWGELVAEIKSHELYQVIAKTISFAEAKVKTWINDLVKVVKTQAPIIEAELTAFKVEVMNQVEVLKAEGERLYERAVAFAAEAVETCKNACEAVKTKAETLIADATAQYKDATVMVVSKYEKFVEIAQKVYETATIEEIVTYIQKQSLSIKASAEIMAAKIIEEVKALIIEYKAIISKLNVKEQMKMVAAKVRTFVDKYINMLEPYYQKLQAFLEEYKQIIIAKYEKLSAEAVAQYQRLSAAALAQYEKYVAQLKAKYGEDITKIITKVKEISAKAVARYNEMSAVAIAKYTKLRMDLEALFKEVKERCTAICDEVSKRATVIGEIIAEKVSIIEKMTVRQTVDLLAKIPAELEKMSKMKFEQLMTYLKKVQGEISAKFNTVISEAKVVYNTLKARFEVEAERVKELLKQLRLKVDDVIDILAPYVDAVRQAVLKVQNEIVDTALFAYNYYNLGEKFDEFKKYIVAEIEKIVEALKQNLPVLMKVVRQYIEDYRHQLDMSSSVLKGYAFDAQDFTANTLNSVQGKAKTSGEEILRKIHEGLRYLETVDKEMLMSKLREFVNIVKKHITVIQKEGQVIVKMIHPNLRPTIQHYTNVVKAQAKNTYQQINNKGKELLQKIEAELPQIEARMNELKAQIREAVMKNTIELRRDLSISYKVNKNIVVRLYYVVSRVVSERYTTEMQRLETLKATLTTAVAKGQVLGNQYYEQFVALMKQAYGNAEKIVAEISAAPTPKVMFEKLVAYINKAVSILKSKYQPQLERDVTALLGEMKSTFNMLNEKYPVEDLPERLVTYLKNQDLSAERLDSIIAELKNSLTEVTADMEEALSTVREAMLSGADISTMTLKVQEVWDQLIEMLSSVDVRGTMCKVDPELCTLVDEGVEVHKNLLKKYLAYLSVGKAQVDRVIREMNTKVTEKTTEKKYQATAMIMGNRIMTFDGKLYDMVGFSKTKKGPSPCNYLLARDFKDKKFTLSKLDNAIIVETAKMTVKIRNDGQTKTTIGNGVSFGLPMEVGNSRCVRTDNLIRCHFEDEGVKITVDTKNDFTTVSVSGWYKGKSQGLFGTINNEEHDEWRLPNSRIADNINEFTNAYELSGNAQCKLDVTTDHETACNNEVSQMCAAYFDSSAEASPYKEFFTVADPAPFLEACTRETKCLKKNKKAHCEVVAAFVGFLRTKGVWDAQITNECMMAGGRQVNEEWIQKPTRQIDVVVMASHHQNMSEIRKHIPSTLLHLHKNLRTQGKYNVRYALVGFGGRGVYEAAHVHALRNGKTIFGYIHDLRNEIRSMKLDGTGDVTNDGYHAILTANQLKFRPGAEKVFLMFNTVPHKTHPEGPSFAETKFILEREANAPLFVFDKVTFQSFGKAIGRVIGETERKLYTSNNLKGIASKDLEMPASEFKDLVLLSRGGLFSNSIKNTKQTAAALFNAVNTWVRTDMTKCKRCVLRASWTGQSRAVCVSDATVRC